MVEWWGENEYGRNRTKLRGVAERESYSIVPEDGYENDAKWLLAAFQLRYRKEVARGRMSKDGVEERSSDLRV